MGLIKHVDNIYPPEHGYLPEKWYLLPLSRLVKFYSVLLNLAGRIGPIPEGMSAVTALRTQEYMKQHKAIGERLAVKTEKFKQERGYEAPYWVLVKLARMSML